MTDVADLPQIFDRPSLHSFIRDQLDGAGRLADPFMKLPDEQPADPSHVGFMAGARDGLIEYHLLAGDTARRRIELAIRIGTAAIEPSVERLSDLLDAIGGDVLAYIDDAIEELVRLDPPTARVALVGGWLASRAPERGAVKVGMALLGITGAPDGQLLHELGAHEEFTLFAAQAFTTPRADPEPDLFTLVRNVAGWGRIHCVNRLAGTDDPEIRTWILRQGFRNTVMNEYLAYTAATTGGLADALDITNPDRKLLTAAGDIVDALLAGGPAQDIDDYADAVATLQRWLGHMDTRAETVADLLAIDHTRYFLETDDGWDQRLTGARTPEIRARLTVQTVALLGRPQWPERVDHALSSEDQVVFWRAEQAARVLGIDVFDRVLARIDADPIGGPWFLAWRGVDDDRARILAARARDLLDLGSIASTAMGVGPGFEEHRAFFWTLQALKDHVGLAPELVAIGLASPSVQNRNAALHALTAWGLGHWTTEQLRLLQMAATTDPDDKVRARAADLLALGQPG